MRRRGNNIKINYKEVVDGANEIQIWRTASAIRNKE
jgi:hypothetical protein